MRRGGLSVRRSAEDLVFTTAAVRAGIEACVDLIDAVRERSGPIYLPIPVEVCEGEFVDLGALGWLLEPLLALYHSGGEWLCYGSLRDIRRRAFASAELAALAVKAKVFGKIDLREWDALFVAPPPEPPRPSLAIGYIGRGTVICGAPTPTPIELAANLWPRLGDEDKTALAKYITKYIDLIVSSVNLDEAYLRLTSDQGYREFANRLVHHMGN